jgi:hypothetical protein
VVGLFVLSLTLAGGALVAAPSVADTRGPLIVPTARVSVMTQNIFYGGDD